MVGAVSRSRMVKLRTFFVTLACVAATHAAAQSVNAGRIAYTTPQVSGQKSCSASTCHGNDPRNNQSKILRGADDPGAIGLAISQVTQMAFMKPAISTIPFADLAAYIGNPGGVTGTAAAQLAPTALTFPSTAVGSSAPSQQFAISNTGTAALLVSSVSSSNGAEFTLVSNCGSIAAGASCDVSVGFTPSAAGTRTGTITVAHNAAGGASTLSVSGTATAPVVFVPGIEVTPAALEFGPITAGSFSGVQLVTVNSVGTAPLTLSAITVTGSNFSIIAGVNSCSVNTPIAVGRPCIVPVRFTPAAAGALTATLSISHNAGATAATVNLSGTGVASTPSNVKTMVEYIYVPLNYFFVTSRDDDKATLDAISSFQRTGLSFPVYATQTGSAKAISRFYFDKVAMNSSRGSHFYTLLDADKSALTALNPDNAQTPRLPYNEGIDSWAFLPVVAGVGGSCASGQTPVYRLFRNATRFPDDRNHRFTSDVATYNAFVALGWDGEGVNFCVPTP